MNPSRVDFPSLDPDRFVQEPNPGKCHPDPQPYLKLGEGIHVFVHVTGIGPRYGIVYLRLNSISLNYIKLNEDGSFLSRVAARGY